MSKQKNGKTKRGDGILKKGTKSSHYVEPKDINAGFNNKINKSASLEKMGEYSTTTTQSFFYSPELNTMGS